MSFNLLPTESGGDFSWVHESEAFKLRNSDGEKKLRADIVDLFGEDLSPEDQINADIANQFRIALANDKIEEREIRDKPVVSNHWGEVAVRVYQNDKTGKDGYAFFNIQSLTYRLGLSKFEIVDAEEHGTLHLLLKVRLREIVTEQKKLNEILQAYIKGNNDEIRNPKNIRIIQKFSYMVDDQFIYKKVDKFVKGKISESIFLRSLSKKLWWKTPLEPKDKIVAPFKRDFKDKKFKKRLIQ